MQVARRVALHLAFELCDEVAVFDKGTIVHRASTAEFRRDPDNRAPAAWV